MKKKESGSDYRNLSLWSRKEELKTSINDLLKEGFVYSPQMTSVIEFDGEVWNARTNQKKLSVVSKQNE